MTPLDAMLALVEVGMATCAVVFALCGVLWAVRKVGR